MTQGVPTKVTAASLGLAAFAIAIVAGIATDNPTQTTVIRAVIALFACNVLGFIIGGIAERVVLDHVAQYKRDNPVKRSKPRVADVDADGRDVDEDGVLLV